MSENHGLPLERVESAGAEHLAACPFCGSDEARLYPPTCTVRDEYNPSDRLHPIVRCGHCYAEVPGDDGDKKGATAVRHWNHRPTPGLTVERVEAALRDEPKEDYLPDGSMRCRHCWKEPCCCGVPVVYRDASEKLRTDAAAAIAGLQVERDEALAAAPEHPTGEPERFMDQIDADQAAAAFIDGVRQSVSDRPLGHETWSFDRADGRVVVLWDGMKALACAVVVRDDSNFSQLFRWRAQAPSR